MVALDGGSAVLAIGGFGSGGGLLRTTELYDVATDTWSSGASLYEGRADAFTAVLPQDLVLVLGGTASPSTSAELLAADRSAFQPTGSPAYPRREVDAVLLDDGSVFVAGGRGQSSPAVSVQRYLPDAGLWETLPALPVGRAHMGLAQLSSGRLLGVGGRDEFGLTATVFLHDEQLGWLGGPDLPRPRFFARVFALPDGRVMVVGGNEGSGPSTTSLIYE